MRNAIYIVSIISALVFPMITLNQPKDYEKEIIDTEKAFEKMAAQKGIAEAFYFFAAKDAIIKQKNDTLIKGRENIRKHFAGQDLKNTTVKWDADFVSVSKSGDMAYTYGKYVWTVKTDKQPQVYKGVFHTVWQRQDNGEWKYVWD